MYLLLAVCADCDSLGVYEKTFSTKNEIMLTLFCYFLTQNHIIHNGFVNVEACNADRRGKLDVTARKLHLVR